MTVNESKKMTDGLIVYSVLTSDFEKLDFRNDALAGVRANYFNSNCTVQRESSDIVINGNRYLMSYLLEKGKPLSWKLTNNNQPFQTVKKGSDNFYTVVFHSENGGVYKRVHFNGEHTWLRTEYFNKKLSDRILCSVSPKIISGILTLQISHFKYDGTTVSKTLFPSDKMPPKKSECLIYSNMGMIWYDEEFRPEDLYDEIKPKKHSNKFSFDLPYFSSQASMDLSSDINNSDYLDYPQEETQEENESEEKQQSYSAYEKIENILFEAQKTNKDLFGEIINTVSDDDFIVPQDVFSDENIEKCDETACDTEVVTKSGAYRYYGSLNSSNLRDGKGRTVSPQGITSYDGEYKNDKRNGFGVCYYKSGEINYVGEWQENNRTGRGIGFRQSDCTMHSGCWNNNKPEGLGARFDKNGKFIDLSNYINGVKDGISITFDEHNNLIISKWKDGEKISEQTVSIGEF